MDRLLREEEMGYGVDLDVTKYVDGKRFTLNPDHGERADPDEVTGPFDECVLSFTHHHHPHQQQQQPTGC